MQRHYAHKHKFLLVHDSSFYSLFIFIFFFLYSWPGGPTEYYMDHSEADTRKTAPSWLPLVKDGQKIKVSKA